MASLKTSGIDDFCGIKILRLNILPNKIVKIPAIINLIPANSSWDAVPLYFKKRIADFYTWSGASP
ncbi:MAG: hypothetical protein V8T08_03000 [Monoglobus pectinilyticus]|uniref:hypothetical protein n=1 Tax=Monoglobus pectinilyticus TaxID=1981510 RepID=UPI00300F13BD